MVGAAQGALDVAENRVHPTKLGTLDRGFPAAGHHRLMHAACRGHAIEAGQPIGEHLRARTQVLLRPSGDFSETEALDHSELHAQRMSLLIGLDRGHERGLARRAPSALAAAALASEVGIVELDEPAEQMLAVALHHHLHQLVAHAPRRVVGDAELAVQLHRRCTFLVLSHEVDALEPHRQGQLGGLEDGAGGNGGLAVAAIALLELVCGQLAASVVAAVRAHETVGPAPSVQGVEALLFGSIEREELVEADSFLELYRVAGHGILLLYQLITWRYSILSTA